MESSLGKKSGSQSRINEPLGFNEGLKMGEMVKENFCHQIWILKWPSFQTLLKPGPIPILGASSNWESWKYLGR
jgi:hypothetical protein